MGAGAPFPELYDWTWGELVDYINVREKNKRNDLRTQAMMNFKTVGLLSRMFSAQRGQKFNVMEEYSFLWTDEERNEAKREALKNSLLAKTKKKGNTPTSNSVQEGGLTNG